MVHWCISHCMNHKPLELVLLFIHFILFSKRLMYMYIQFKELQIFLEKSISFLRLYSSVRVHFSCISTKKKKRPKNTETNKGIFQSSFLRNYSYAMFFKMSFKTIVHNLLGKCCYSPLIFSQKGLLWTLQILYLLQKTNLKINNRTISLVYTLFH